MIMWSFPGRLHTAIYLCTIIEWCIRIMGKTLWAVLKMKYSLTFVLRLHTYKLLHVLCQLHGDTTILQCLWNTRIYSSCPCLYHSFSLSLSCLQHSIHHLSLRVHYSPSVSLLIPCPVCKECSPQQDCQQWERLGWNHLLWDCELSSMLTGLDQVESVSRLMTLIHPL